MRVQFRVSAVEKAGNEPEEYEDACFPRCSGEVEAWYLRAAVADGASETSFAREWARELVDGFGRRKLDEDRVAAAVPRLQRRWRSRVSDRPLAWYAQEKLRAGAFSSLLGLTIVEGDRDFHHDLPSGVSAPAPAEQPAAGGHWRAMAVGDTCLFHVRAGAILKAFPLAQSGEFSIRPRLIGSVAASNVELPSIVCRAHGSWRHGDRMILATDAAAQWLLRSVESGEDALSNLGTATMNPDSFRARVDKLRRVGTMRNDDVTVLIVDLEVSQP